MDNRLRITVNSTNAKVCCCYHYDLDHYGFFVEATEDDGYVVFRLGRVGSCLRHYLFRICVSGFKKTTINRFRRFGSLDIFGLDNDYALDIERYYRYLPELDDYVLKEF